MNGPSAWKEGRLGSLQATDHTKTWQNFLYRAFRLYLQQVAFVNRDKFITADPKYLVELMLKNIQHFFGSLVYHCVNHHGWIFKFFLSSLHWILLWIVLCFHGSYLNWRYITAVFTGTWISTTHSDGDSTKSATKYWKKKLHTLCPFHKTHWEHWRDHDA